MAATSSCPKRHPSNEKDLRGFGQAGSERTDDEKMLFTEAEASAMLGVKPRQMIDLRRRGEIGFVRVGRLVRYRRKDMEKFVADHAINPRS